ncbi:LamG domain-containing protein [Xanthomonas graminis]|uniref:LamG-like jellyroll fold domain-containing protein n=1 Tax=Xanthomonas graminis pv. poae TaxID=227946 RepID=A0A199P4D9_9XANT|nr:LamG domain-containing protein [Xanthomonas translucens]OAX55870.1 hypothetical protein A6R73_15490 [Xanthomonas translucens pv. poae]
MSQTSPYSPANTSILLQLDAAGSVNSTVSSLVLNGAFPFSIDALVRFKSLPLSQDMPFVPIVSQAGIFQFGASGAQLALLISGMAPAVTTTAPLLQGTWQALAVTCSGSQVYLYIDGELVAGPIAIGGSPGSVPADIVIGNLFEGELRRVRAFNVALTADQVLANMYTRIDDATVAFDYDFSVNPPCDQSNNKFPVALAGSAAMISEVPALRLQATAYARPLYQKHVNPGGGLIDPYTVQADVYITDSSLSNDQYIFINGDIEDSSGMGLFLRYNGSSGFNVVSERGANWVGDALVSTAVIPLNQWSNIATTFDGTTLCLYIDGVLDASKAFGPIAETCESSYLVIGAARSVGQPTGATPLQGYVASVDVWNLALTAADIQLYLQAPPPVDASGLLARYDFTLSPARNLVDGHPIGLVDGARIDMQIASISAQTVIASSAFTGSRPRQTTDSTFPATGEALIAALNAELKAASATPGADSPHLQAQRAWTATIVANLAHSKAVPFMISSEIQGDAHVIYVDQGGKRWEAGRAVGFPNDDISVWKAQLVFTVVFGVVDLISGLKCDFTQQGRAYIGKILTDPKIAANLSLGAAMTGAGIFEIVRQLYNGGYLRILVGLLVSVGYWALLRVVARLILVFSGITVAAWVVSLASTALAFATVYKNKPQPPPTPDPVDPLPLIQIMEVRLAFDPTQTLRNSLPFYADPQATRLAAVDTSRFPDGWYLLDDTRTICIQARFAAAEGFNGIASIQATGSAEFGQSNMVEVTFVNGVSDYITFQFANNGIGQGGVRARNATLTWNGTILGVAGNFGITNHRVYVTLKRATLPWLEYGDPTQRVWKSVLDYACQWAEGTLAVDGAAAAITTRVNNSGLRYDSVNGAAFYVEVVNGNSQFNLTSFTRFLSGSAFSPRTVNCTDCATIVTTFANALGCELLEAVMTDPQGNGFATNMIIAIGSNAFGPTFPGRPSQGRFSYHEVAWSSGFGGASEPIYDACLQVDGSTTPWPGASMPTLPTPMTFSVEAAMPALPIPTPYATMSYRSRLCANSADGIGKCIPSGAAASTQFGHRRVF